MPIGPDPIAKLAALKAEHRPILEQIAADPGMAAETRRTLLVHLMEEEDEYVAAALGGASAGPAPKTPTIGEPASTTSAPSTGATGRAFTVGSLRVAAPASLTLGSLRR
jgi:hypothetical protein